MDLVLYGLMCKFGYCLKARKGEKNSNCHLVTKQHSNPTPNQKCMTKLIQGMGYVGPPLQANKY